MHGKCKLIQKKNVASYQAHWIYYSRASEAVTGRCFIKKLFLKTFMKQILTKVFSSEFCEIFKNTDFIEHFRTTAFIEHLRTTASRTVSEVLITLFSLTFSFIIVKVFRAFSNVFLLTFTNFLLKGMIQFCFHKSTMWAQKQNESQTHHNPLQANNPFLYPLETLENLWLSDVFREYGNGILA